MTVADRELITGLLDWHARTHSVYLPTPRARERQGEAFAACFNAFKKMADERDEGRTFERAAREAAGLPPR